jgi:hypothetical protein
MRTLRRYLTLISLMFWLGGFTFYASIVVPIGMDVMKGSALRQGFITRRVATELNVTAAVALSVLLAEVFLTADSSRRRWARLGLWSVMALCQVGLFIGHAYLDARLQVKGMIVLDSETFRTGHRVYLWTHTVQWGAGLVFIWLMLRAWAAEDGRVSGSPPPRVFRSRFRTVERGEASGGPTPPPNPLP